MLDGQVVREELARMEEKRRLREQAAQARNTAFLERHPDVEEALRAMRVECVRAARLAAAGALDPEPARRARERYEALRAAALAADGLTARELEPAFDCSRCRDTGYAGDAEKTLCGCVVTAALARMGHSARLRPECTFGAADMTVFPEIAATAGKPVNQRQQMIRLYEYCNRWIDAFPGNKRPHLLLYGGAGLGKTYLLHAMAHRIIDEKQTAVLNTTAYHIIAEARHGFDALGSIEPYLTAPVLLIDDLGAEPVIPGVSAETLFTVLNERQSDGRHTLAATNLTLPELSGRYGERLLSRLTRRETFVMELAGQDVRVR